MSYIYGLFGTNGDCYYIGSTENPTRRKKEHIQSLLNKKHSNKTLQKKFNECGGAIEFKVLYELKTDNTLIKFMLESLVNSVYKPKCNKCIIQQGRSKVILQRCDEDIAKELINVITK